MSKKGKKSKQYTASDILSYWKGQLSNEEMHAIEKAALEDPFLADAMEGVQQLVREKGSEKWELDLDELNWKLKDKKKLASSRKIEWGRIAAALLLFLGSGILYFYFSPKKDQQTHALLQKPQNPKLVDSMAESYKEKADSSFIPAIVSAHKADLARNNTQRRVKAPPLPDKTVDNIHSKADSAVLKSAASLASAHLAGQVLPKKAEAIEDRSNASKYKNELGNFTEPERLSSKVEMYRKRNLSAAELLKNRNAFTGKIIDANNQPIISAAISLNETDISTLTDARGVFTINLPKPPDSILNITIHSLGYQPTSLRLKNSQASANIIRLQPNRAQLGETASGIATGNDQDDEAEFSASKNVDQRQQKRVAEAIPVAGWAAYKNYLDKNKYITTADSVLKGKEVISFQVNKKGKLSSLAIQKSLSAAHDAEAIRLVKAGPGWKLSEGKKGRATVVILF